eukprot:TRINITY_DN28985_c0_g1_i1.p1 TRINITY_DN28985_c0_g1~~TRINITY_DN28985_c0_g1_i1.p1  ORF type:complete len:632 (+),score=85.26 TRINITY_DN28985_c0_g1_i1:196-1896(+)
MCGIVHRRTLEEAASIAGFRRARMLRAPIGAALWRQAAALGPDLGGGRQVPNGTAERQTLIIDVGAGHVSCALVTIEGGVFESRWAGGAACGGGDVDEAIRNLVLHGELDEKSVSDAALFRLLAACEKAKCSLSTTSVARVVVDKFSEAGSLDREVTLASLESRAQDIVRDEIVSVLSDLKAYASQYMLPARSMCDEAILIGGSAKLPKFQVIVEEACKEVGFRSFSVQKTAPNKIGVDYLFANAYGCALQGAILGDRAGPLQGIMLIDSCPSSLGVEIAGEPVWSIERNTPIPTRREVQVKEARQNQPGLTIHLWERVLHEKHRVCTYMIKDLDRLSICFEIDAANRVSVDLTPTDEELMRVLGAFLDPMRQVRLPRGRPSVLFGVALDTLKAKFAAGDLFTRYGKRPSLPQESSATEWHDWPVELEKCDEGEDEEEETQDEEDGNVRGPSQRAAVKDRLRKKLEQRRVGKNKLEHAKTVEAQPPSSLCSTTVCVVCLSSEKEIGRPFPWVLEKCGHKCICKSCLRKMKTHKRKVEIKCPLCRVRSRPVLRSQYDGQVYVAEEDE